MEANPSSSPQETSSSSKGSSSAVSSSSSTKNQENESSGYESPTQSSWRTIKLEKEMEFRFEVANNTIELQLVKGTAEIFGTEIAPHKTYKFQNANLAVFTWEGATLQIDGETSQEYTANATAMSEYINAHAKLEKIRSTKGVEGPNAAVKGPRVIVVGPGDSGKTSLCKIFSSYATRLGRKVAFIDLDVGQNLASVPGSIASVQLTAPIDVEDGLNLSSPLSFFFGHSSIDEKNGELYKKLVERMAECIEFKCNKDDELQRGGLIINPAPCIETLGYSILLHVIKAFKVTHIFVISDDRLSANLHRDLQGMQVSIEGLPKSGGAVIRSDKYKDKFRISRIKEYFYGTLKNRLSPYSVVVEFSKVTFVRIGGVLGAPKSALPIGSVSMVNPLEVRELSPSDLNEQTLMMSVLGVSHAKTKEEVLTKNLCGIVYVENVDLNKKEMTVLCPSPGSLPNQYLLLGSIKWLD